MTRVFWSSLTVVLFASMLCLSGCGGGGGGAAEFNQPGEGDGPSDQEVQEELDNSDQESERFQEAYPRPGN